MSPKCCISVVIRGDLTDTNNVGVHNVKSIQDFVTETCQNVGIDCHQCRMLDAESRVQRHCLTYWCQDLVKMVLYLLSNQIPSINPWLVVILCNDVVPVVILTVLWWKWMLLKHLSGFLNLFHPVFGKKKMKRLVHGNLADNIRALHMQCCHLDRRSWNYKSLHCTEICNCDDLQVF